MCPHCWSDDCEDSSGHCPADPRHPDNDPRIATAEWERDYGRDD